MVIMKALLAAQVLGSAAAFSAPAATTPATTTAAQPAAAGPRSSSNDFLAPSTLERAKAGNKWEKLKLQKPGEASFTDIREFAAAVRSGQYTWEELDVDDADIRLKWAGLFHRRKRNPGTFMVRMKIPSGIVSSDHMRIFADTIAKYDPTVGCLDITTRQSVQLRGVTIEDAPELIDAVQKLGITTFMSGADNTRNIVGNPLAGIDPYEIIDTRPICKEINEMIVGTDQLSPEFANLPRKFNIAVSGSRDDFSHTHINDIGLVSVVHPETGVVGFNVVVGGFFSIKRAAASVDLDMFIPAHAAVNLCRAVLQLYRDEGSRKDRTKNRLMYLIEDWGVETFRWNVRDRMQQLGVASKDIESAVPEPTEPFTKRPLTGVHPQKQAGLSWVGVCIPVGRLTAEDCHLVADFADAFSSGEVRFTVEQGVIFPNVPDSKLAAMKEHPLVKRFPLSAGALTTGTVSCTGSQFCGFGLITTKEKAMEVNQELESKLNLPEPVRIHWTGCPNSCGQAQVGDIGIMGSIARVDGKAVEGVDIFLGGKIGEHASLGEKVLSKIPMSLIVPTLEKLLIDNFNASYK